MRKGLRVNDSPPPSSSIRQCRKGAAGVKALQWGSSNKAIARLNVT